MKVVIIASTGGGVISRLLPVPFFRERILSVVSDRPCGAIDVAQKFGVPAKIFPSEGGLAFSNSLVHAYRDEGIDLFVSFYTRLFRGEFLTFSHGRLVNLHPSLLPACPGMDGFGDTVRSGAKFIGATLHYIDEGTDTGDPIIQAVTPFNPGISLQENRHKVFIQQCKMLLQLFAWVESRRLSFSPEKHSYVIGARYDVGEFSPNLDFPLALDFDADLCT